MQSLQKLESECLTYFKSEPVWRKVLTGFLEKYVSFGKFTGKVQLKNLSADEIEVLEGFFGQNFHGRKSITISAERFAKALENSRYKEISPDQLLAKSQSQRKNKRKKESRKNRRLRMNFLTIVREAMQKNLRQKCSFCRDFI